MTTSRTETVHFWTTTLALIELEVCGVAASGEAAARYSASRRAHALVRDGLADGGLRYSMISFTKSRERLASGSAFVAGGRDPS